MTVVESSGLARRFYVLFCGRLVVTGFAVAVAEVIVGKVGRPAGCAGLWKFEFGTRQLHFYVDPALLTIFSSSSSNHITSSHLPLFFSFLHFFVSLSPPEHASNSNDEKTVIFDNKSSQRKCPLSLTHNDHHLLPTIAALPILGSLLSIFSFRFSFLYKV